MVKTPWGEMEELRRRRPRPGPHRAREQVRRRQRERILAAMVASTAGKGYPATTVADLVSLAGVSRATFYEQFDGKADCFRTAMETLIEAGLAAIRTELEDPGNFRERGERALRSFLELTAGQNAAAKVALVDSYSAGEAGLEPINGAFEDACRLMHGLLRMLPGAGRTPEILSRAVIGGLYRVIYAHIERGEERELLAHSTDLWAWASGYPPPEDALLAPRRRRGRRRPSPSIGRDEYERILRGFARSAAARGFARTSVPQVSAEAGISNTTFYRHFESREDALLAALDLSGAQLLAATLPQARRAVDWPQAVHRALEGLCAFLAAEPAFAKLRAVEVYAAGPTALSARDRAWETILEELVPADVRSAYPAAELVLPASSGAIYALIYERVRDDELEALPELGPLFSYLVLTPLIGAEEATSVALGRGASGAASRRGRST